MEKTRFRDLSGWLKAAIIGGWVALGSFGISFIIGFFAGLLSY